MMKYFYAVLRYRDITETTVLGMNDELDLAALCIHKAKQLGMNPINIAIVFNKEISRSVYESYSDMINKYAPKQ